MKIPDKSPRIGVIESLESLKERYELAIAGSKDGIWDWDMENDTLYVSDRWKTMLGYEADSFPDTKGLFGKLVHPDDSEKTFALLEEFYKSDRQNFEVKFRLRHKSGHYRWILSKAQVKRNENGQAIRMAGSHTDITESLRTETKLKESSLVAEKVANGILIADADGHTVWANDSFLEMFEISFDDLKGKKPRDIFNINKEDVPGKVELRSGATYSAEFEVNTFKNNRKWVKLDNSVYQDESGGYRQLEVVTDISEIKKREEEIQSFNRLHQTLLNSIPGYVVCRDSEGRFVFANEKFAALFGKSPQEVIGLTDKDYGASPEEIAVYLKADQEVIETGQPKFIPEEVVLRADGTRGVFESTKIPIDIFGLEKSAVLITAFDITDRKQVERKREEQRKLRERYNEILVKLSKNAVGKFDSFSDCLNYINQICTDVLMVDKITFWECEKDSLVCQANFENGQSKTDKRVLGPQKISSYVDLLNSQLVLIFGDPLHNKLAYDFMDRPMQPDNIRSALDIPLQAAGRLGGVMCLESVTNRNWTAEDISFANSLSDIVSIAQDSFELNRVKNELEQSNLRLEKILLDSGDLTFVLGIQNLVINECYQNPDKIELYIPKEEFIGKEFSKLDLPVETKRIVQKALKKTIQTGDKQTLEYELPLPNGASWFKLISSLISYIDQPDELIVTIEDISEKKKYQLELEQISSILIETQESTQTGGWELDLITGKIKLSSQVYAIYEELEDYELSVYNSVKFYTPEDRYEIKKGILGCIRNRATLDKEVVLTTGAGNKKWIRFRVWPSNHEGAVHKILGSVQDITSIKKAQNELQELNYQFEWYGVFLDGTKDAIQVANAAGQLVYVNDKAAERLGISANEVLHYHISDFEPEFKEKGKWDEHVQILKSEESITLEGTTVNIKTKDSIPVEVTVRYMERDNEGFVIAVLRDISERKRADKALKDALKKAEVANTAKSEFLANMSHEIRTPLNGVIGFTDLLMESEMENKQKEYVETVHRSANSLLDIINDILDFSKIEAGKIVLNIERTDVFQMGSKVTEVLKYPVQKKGLELLLNISTLAPNYIWVDPVRLRQILINLLGNAVKFTERGEIELKVTNIKNLKDGEAIFRFSVRDTGIGIDQENQNKIYEAFAQEDASTTKRFGGTGLGLTISNKLLALMGSKLQLKSTLGEGSTFYFDLKLKAEFGDESDQDDYKHLSYVLIVDDNASNRKILTQMLLSKNIKSKAVASGQKAIDLVKNGNKYDCILIDYFMPGMNGIEATKEIRALDIPQEAQPVVLLYSSADDDSLHAECEALNISQKLIKPLNSKMLFKSLANLAPDVHKIQEVKKPIKKTINSLAIKKFTILLVEDNNVNRLLARVVLDTLAPNSTVIEAVNGIEAIEKYKEHKIDIIFMDIQMPEMNGYEATGKIRELEKDSVRLPIVALTAGTVKGEKEKCLAVGMDEYVSKPFVKKTIETVLKKWLNITDGKNTIEDYPDKYHIDWDRLNENVAHNAVFLNAFFPHVRKSLIDSVVELKESNENGDFEMIDIVSHRIKGTAMSGCMGILSELAAELECLENYDYDVCRKLIDQIDDEVKILAKLI